MIAISDVETYLESRSTSTQYITEDLVHNILVSMHDCYLRQGACSLQLQWAKLCSCEATSASVRTLTRNVIKRSEEPTAKELAPVLIYLDRITLEISLYLYS